MLLTYEAKTFLREEIPVAETLACKVCETLAERGHEAYLVGGCVRDMLMGRVPHDYDVCSSAKPEEVVTIWGDYAIPTGVKYGTVTVLASLIDNPYMKRTPIEVTTFRGDGSYEDGRHPNDVEFVETLEEDLERRDFTVNAMAYDPATDRIYALDPISMDDLKLGTIRCVGNPDERFSEDALRMLRAVRFCATLGFRLHADTMKAIVRNAHLIQKVSKERIRDELTKILTSERPETMWLAQILGLTKYFLPEFDDVVACPQNNKWHRMGVADHTFDVVRGVDRNNKALRWAAFLHDFGKPATRTTDEGGHDHYYGHPAVSASIAADVCERLKFDNDSKEKIVKLCETHDLLSPGMKGRGGYRRAIARIGDDLFPEWAQLRGADILAHSMTGVPEGLELLSKVKETFIETQEQNGAFTIKKLKVNGNDVCEALGVGPGPIVGEALRYLLEVVLDDPSFNEKEKLISKLKEWKK